MRHPQDRANEPTPGAAESAMSRDPQTPWEQFKTRPARVLVGVVALGAVVIAAIGFAGSYTAVRDLAERKNFGAFAPFFPIGIDAGIVVLLALDLLLTWIRIPFPLLRQTAWLLTAATIAFNGAAAWPDPVGVGMHAVIPILFVVAVEAARHAVGRVADITVDRHMEGVRVSRWLLAFPSTFRMWRRMKLWELRSYNDVIRMEQDRLVYETHLRSRYGRNWRRKAPVESLMPLKLARYGVPLSETLPSGGTAAGIPQDLERLRTGQAQNEEQDGADEITDDFAEDAQLPTGAEPHALAPAPQPEPEHVQPTAPAAEHVEPEDAAGVLLTAAPDQQQPVQEHFPEQQPPVYADYEAVFDHQHAVPPYAGYSPAAVQPDPAPAPEPEPEPEPVIPAPLPARSSAPSRVEAKVEQEEIAVPRQTHRSGGTRDLVAEVYASLTPEERKKSRRAMAALIAPKVGVGAEAVRKQHLGAVIAATEQAEEEKREQGGGAPDVQPDQVSAYAGNDRP